MVGAGQPGHIFAGKFKPYSNDDLFKMLGVYIMDGLSPVPQLLRKMQPQSKESTWGNDFIAKHIGLGYEQLYYSFRNFFGVQDPLLHKPQKDCPNWKVDELFRWQRFIMKEAWCLAEDFSVDEQTCKMQGRSSYKTRSGRFKRIGDGIQVDCIADDGYTFDFYFRNEPVDQRWIDKGMCPMHARLLHMFSNLRDVGHRCNMDNTFNSVNLARAGYALPTKVLCQGVIRKSGRGVPPCVVQDEVKGKRADAVRGTTKVAVLRGDSKSLDLVIGSGYDQKPFYMISHCIEEITWVEHSKRVWSRALKMNVDYSFLRWNISHDYNFKMNDNDIADQLRLVYRIQRFQRNYKWWFALFLWSFEVSLVNAYMMQRRYCELRGIPRKWDHDRFKEAIAKALIDPDGCWPRRKSPGKLIPSTPAPRRPRDSALRQRTPRIDFNALSPSRGRLNE